MKTAVDFKKRNMSLGEASLNPLSQTKTSTRRERSVGTLAADLKKAFQEEQRRQRKYRVEDSRKRKNQTLKDKLAESVMMDFNSQESSQKTNYNVLSLKYNQFQDKANAGWRTERISKDFSIKKNSHDWLMLKDRLSLTKVKPTVVPTVEEDAKEEEYSPEQKAKEAKVELLSEVSRIERDASKWLSEDGTFKNNVGFKRLLSHIKGSNNMRRRTTHFNSAREGLSAKKAWQK